MYTCKVNHFCVIFVCMRILKPKFLLSAALFISASFQAGAQFFSDGTDAGSLKWKEMSTQHYRVIYPDFADSLAFDYARTLEKVWQVEGRTARKIPVILHTQSAISNGSVVWAPSRVELYTTPDCFTPGSDSWAEHLIIHESRHVAQMQPGYDRKYTLGRVLFGELFPSAMVALYQGPAFMEGDAVTAETALTRSGRGRQASFLEYYRVCFEQGDMRNYWRWRYGSNKYYTPDYYRAGYLQIAGIRALYNVPDLTGKYYDRMISKPLFPIGNFNKTVKESTGRNFKTAWKEICDSLAGEWAADRNGRAPFDEMRAITKDHRRFTSYSKTTVMDNKLYVVREGMDRAAELVEIDSCGKIRTLHKIGSGINELNADKLLNRIVWTENVVDPRWENKSYSVIKYYELDDKVRSLTTRTKYFQICCSEVSKKYAVIEYCDSGSSTVAILDSETADIIKRYPAPDNIEITDLCWMGEKLFVTATDSTGMGIFEVDEEYRKVLGGGNSVISELKPDGDNRLMFACDKSGTNQIYAYDFNTNSYSKLTNTPNGCSDFAIQKDSLYLSTISPSGRNIFVTKVNNLVDNFNFDYINPSFIASSVTLQEKANFDSLKREISFLEGKDYTVRKYSKLGHLLRFHSWAPVFVNYDAIESMSFSSLGSSAGLGASLFFQNDLGSAKGFLGYHAAPGQGRWNHSGHLKFTYEGWYPILELSASVNERNQVQYQLTREVKEDHYLYKISTSDGKKPLLTAGIKVYIPFKFNSNGLYRGIVPTVNWTVTNDIFSIWNDPAQRVMNRLTASLRTYVIQKTPSSCIYPRWGFGLEGGLNFRPGLTDVFAGNSYVYAYGYLPGMLRTHGIKLSAMYEGHFGSGMFCENYLSIAPRGFSAQETLSKMSRYDTQAKFTIDYALPFANVDWTFLCPVTYIRNFELFLHADYSYMSSANAAPDFLYSAGADVNAVLGNLLWIPYTTRIGATFDWKSDNTPYWGLNFSIEF